MKDSYICIVALAVSLVLVNVSQMAHRVKAEKRINKLEQQCDSLQRQIDFMVE